MFRVPSIFNTSKDMSANLLNTLLLTWILNLGQTHHRAQVTGGQASEPDTWDCNRARLPSLLLSRGQMTTFLFLNFLTGKLQNGDNILTLMILGFKRINVYVEHSTVHGIPNAQRDLIRMYVVLRRWHPGLINMSLVLSANSSLILLWNIFPRLSISKSLLPSVSFCETILTFH